MTSSRQETPSRTVAGCASEGVASSGAGAQSCYSKARARAAWERGLLAATAGVTRISTRPAQPPAPAAASAAPRAVRSPLRTRPTRRAPLPARAPCTARARAHTRARPAALHTLAPPPHPHRQEGVFGAPPACVRARAQCAPFFSARAQMCTRKRQREHALRYTAAREPTALPPSHTRARLRGKGRERSVTAGLPPRGRASLGRADRRRCRRRAASVRGRCRSEAAAATASGARPPMGRAGTRAAAGAASPRGAARRRRSGPAWPTPS